MKFFRFNIYLCYELGLDFIVKFYFLYHYFKSHPPLNIPLN